MALNGANNHTFLGVEDDGTVVLVDGKHLPVIPVDDFDRLNGADRRHHHDGEADSTGPPGLGRKRVSVVSWRRP